MSDSARPPAAIVPFGKYKGQPIESLASDREYCEWLAGQDWFRTRYTAIHTLIINNFAEPHETPEHNALQALFTDAAWVERFVWAFLGPLWWMNYVARYRAHVSESAMRAVAAAEENVTRLEPLEGDWYIDKLASARVDLDRIRGESMRHVHWIDNGITPRVYISNLVFEQRGADVELYVQVGIAPKDVPELARFVLNRQTFNPSDGLFFRVECKPALGDDYPAVLRQMIAHESKVLLVGHGGYRGIGATIEQVRTIFAASRIRIVLLADVADADA